MDSNDFFNATEARKDWPEAFQEMAKNGDDELLIPDVLKMKNLRIGLGNNWNIF